MNFRNKARLESIDSSYNPFNNNIKLPAMDIEDNRRDRDGEKQGSCKC
jgi:hypothetical protein